MKLRSHALILSSALTLLAACGGDGEAPGTATPGTATPGTATPGTATPNKATPVADVTQPSEDAQVHALKCGCVIEGVGTCSEYIEVDGELVVLEPPMDLGYMPFCGKDGMQARADGELVDGKFVATTFAYVN